MSSSIQSRQFTVPLWEESLSRRRTEAAAAFLQSCDESRRALMASLRPRIPVPAIAIVSGPVMGQLVAKARILESRSFGLRSKRLSRRCTDHFRCDNFISIQTSSGGKSKI